jgi:hypothetical protein
MYQQSTIQLSILSRADLKVKPLTNPHLITTCGGLRLTAAAHVVSAIYTATAIIAELLESVFYLQMVASRDMVDSLK